MTKPDESAEESPVVDDNASEPRSKVARGDWVRGGTTSSEHDARQAAARADAERRRAEQEKVQQLAATDPQMARLYSMNLFSRSTPSIVLAVMRPRALEPEGWITCELVLDAQAEDGRDDMLLIIACPWCFANRGADESQVTLRQSHTGFSLDPARAGQVWIDPYDRTPVVLAGEVTMHRWAKCPGLGCPLSFMIDKSKVYIERR